MSTRQPPAYFAAVRHRACQRWNQLESDPELAGPWKQLFRQVQSPRHVVSELLQNADDAGAKRVCISMSDGAFVFEHDGRDFNEEEFGSLCRFGFSNKRNLHTIGFRGIGFKSTFSLGDTVQVLTPSLAVEFHNQRFTEPVWIANAPPCDVTRITVRVQDPNREEELRKNLRQWIGSPASLLFFNCINELVIENVTLRKCSIGGGPIPGSERIRLTGSGEHEVLVFASPEEPFPQEALDEISRERDVEELHLPPCRVELILGLPSEQRLYVVLPTGVELQTPFSCNAPFIQDPARSAIKSPSQSPTNRWLLQRLGRLAGSAFLEWLQNKSLETNVRAQAYRLLPRKPHEEDTLQAVVTSAICQGFTDEVGDRPVLLATTGELVTKKQCISPPAGAYAVWTPTQLLEVFGNGQEYVLSEAVAEEHRRRLQSWGWLDALSKQDLIKRLEDWRPIPRPAENKNILALWSMVQAAVGSDYCGDQRRRLAIVPVEGSDILYRAENVIRLPTKSETISSQSWAFLLELLHVVDRQWLQYLDDGKGGDTGILHARQLLQAVNLDHPSDADTVIKLACRSLLGRSNIAIEDHVRIAHSMAALDASTPEDFRWITRDGKQRQPADHIIAMQDPSIEAILPNDWAAAHLLHDAYFREYTSCTRQQWEKWIKSAKSKLRPLIPIVFKCQPVYSKRSLDKLLEARGVSSPSTCPYKSEYFELRDYVFEPDIVAHWTSMAQRDPMIWAKVLEYILRAPWYVGKNVTRARVYQISRRNVAELVDTAFIPAEWIVRLRGVCCLPDTEDHVRVPSELYLRMPDTEHLLGVEPFVRSDLDTEATKPLLCLLGVRDTPAGMDKLIERIRALARAPDARSLLSDIVKWYRAIDRALKRCDASGREQVRAVFANEPLILTAAWGWAKTSEVFQRVSEEDIPDAPVVHPAVSDLSMWAHLGMAERPTLKHVLDWLNSLASGKPLEGGSAQRVRAALRRYPTEIWENCHHWLSLDNVWTPINDLRYRLTMRSLTRWSDLFPAIKAATANLQMLSADVYGCQPFAALADLGTVVEYRLTRRPRALGGPEYKPWLAALGRAIARVKLEDESKTQHVRATAARLARSTWQTFDDQDSIQVTPYVEGTPAGEPHSPGVLWHEQTIFVKKGPLAKYFDILAAELARPFAHEMVAEAIKVCIHRDENFMAEYMEEHFALEPESPLLPEPGAATTKMDQHQAADAADEQIQQPEEPLVLEQIENTEADDALAEDDEEPAHRKRGPSLFMQFAISMGYYWDKYNARFAHPNGCQIQKAERPFQWCQVDSAGNVERLYWAAQQSLDGQGIEVPAELWNFIRLNPSQCSIIVLNHAGRPVELRGPELVRRLEEKEMTLYPSKYRLREDLNRP